MDILNQKVFINSILNYLRNESGVKLLCDSLTKVINIDLALMTLIFTLIVVLEVSLPKVKCLSITNLVLNF